LYSAAQSSHFGSSVPIGVFVIVNMAESIGGTGTAPLKADSVPLRR